MNPPDLKAPVLEWALWYAGALEWPVFPCYGIEEKGDVLYCTCGLRVDDKGPDGSHSPGKHPRTFNGWKDATTDPDVIAQWFEDDPYANVATAYPSALDLDHPRESDPGDGVKEWARLVEKHGRNGYIPRSRSGNGEQTWFAPGAKAGKRGPGMSMRGEGNYAVLPNSRHYSRRRYQWIQPPIVGRPLPSEPDWLIKQGAAAKRKLRKQIAAGEKIEPNHRHEAITDFLVALAKKYPHLPADALRFAGIGFVHENCIGPEEKYGDVDGVVEWMLENVEEAGEEKALIVEPAAFTGDVEGAQLLDDVVTFLRSYMVMSRAQTYVVALFVVLTHCVDAFDVVPYLRVNSPTKRAGKSRLLELMQRLVKRGQRSGGLTEAALFRILEDLHPTLLIDEVGRMLGGKTKDNNQNIEAVLLNGFERGTPVLRCMGEGTNQRTVPFDVFGPKVLGGTGRLDDQVIDRCIPINLKRKTKEEKVDRLRKRKIVAPSNALNARLQAWAAEHVDVLTKAEPDLPEELDDRAQDIAEPLIAVADQIGGEWPVRARRAILELRGGGEALDDDDDMGIELLLDIRKARRESNVGNNISTEHLIALLCSDPERPWKTWHRGDQINPRGLARLLKQYGIKSKNVKQPDGTVPKGFSWDQFEDAFARYLPPGTEISATAATSAHLQGKSGEIDPLPDHVVADQKNPANTHGYAEVAEVADKTAPGPGEEKKGEYQRAVWDDEKGEFAFETNREGSDWKDV